MYPNNQYPPGYPPQQFTPPAPNMQMPAQPTAQQQAPDASAPAFAVPDASTAQKAFEDSQNTGGGGPGFNFFQFLGPNQERKWGGVRNGYVAKYPVWIMPGGWGGRKDIFQEQRSVFIPQLNGGKGGGVNLGASETEANGQVFYEALQAAKNSPDARIAKMASELRVGKRYFYNIAVLHSVQNHFDHQRGRYVPFVLQASVTLHQAIWELLHNRGITNMVLPPNARVIEISKKKTGPDAMNIDYSAIDKSPPEPVPNEFVQVFSNAAALNDLSVFGNPASEDYQRRVITELGFPLPGGEISAPSFNAAPMPPQGNPYPQQPAPQGNPYPQQPAWGAQPQAPAPAPMSRQGYPMPQSQQVQTPPAGPMGPVGAPPSPPPGMTSGAPTGNYAPNTGAPQYGEEAAQGDLESMNKLLQG